MIKSESANNNKIKETQCLMTSEQSYFPTNLIEVLINIFTAVNDLFSEFMLLEDLKITRKITMKK